VILQGGFLRTVRLKESLVTKVSMKKLFLYAVVLVPVNLKPFSTVKHARGSLDFILEIASRSITLKKNYKQK
jgi:hypothetical protein